MEGLNYQESEVERFDDLAFKLYMERLDETKERLLALLYQFFDYDDLTSSWFQELLKRKFEEFDIIMKNRTNH